MESLVKDLNQNQKRALEHKSGPLLIVAGAGTGKTTVITRKIAFIIAKKWAKPSEILALTFTDKAAAEMEERVDKLVPYGFVDTTISTFHSFGDRIIRDFAIDLGLPANFKILSKTEQAIFMQENLFAFDLNYYRPISNPTSHIEELLKHFSRLKDELIESEDYLEYALKNLEKVKKENDVDREEAEKLLELANAYNKYQQLMLQNGNLDYGDQIFLAYKLLKENKKVRKYYQSKFKYVLVDEFQDTNFAQYQIVKTISEEHKNITVVGDDDQSIYRFRGASISNILNFKDDYPTTKQIVLNQNYRSTKEILDASYRLICHNNPDRLEIKNKINKKLISPKSGQQPELLHCETLSCEADMVAKKIDELLKKGYKYSDFAILARANNHLEPFIQALNSKGIPNLFVGASSLLDRPEIKMLISFFKCLAVDDDNLAFYQLATSELYGVDENLLASYYSKLKRENKSYQEIFEKSDDKKTAVLIEDLHSYRKNIPNARAGELLYDYLKQKKYFKKLMDENTIESEMKILNIAKFFEKINQFDHVSDNKSVLSFLKSLELVLSVGEEPEVSDLNTDVPAVTLMSVHGSKGLEWPVVFMVNLVSDRFPSRDMKEKFPIPNDLLKEKLPNDDIHLQEERRLFYVGVTRAKDYIFLTSASDYGGKRSKKISQFVLELLDKNDISKLKIKLSPLEKIERFNKQKPLEVRRTQRVAQGLIKLSRQQIDDYFTCPRKYYYASIIKIPLPTNWHFTYGTAIHEAVGRYYQRKINGEKPKLESLYEDFDQSFVSEGFITRQHEEQRKKAGYETLARFFQDDQKINLFPTSIEEAFEFNESNVKVSGRYDLVVKGQQGEIFDFKTSDVKDQKDADRRIRESTQMKIYALAWKEKYGNTPKTTLVFIESDLKGSRIFSDEELEKTAEMIGNVAEGIRKQIYKPNPDKRQCSYCSYNDICPNSIA